jgi:hypothetical protein
MGFATLQLPIESKKTAKKKIVQQAGASARNGIRVNAEVNLTRLGDGAQYHFGGNRWPVA